MTRAAAFASLQTNLCVEREASWESFSQLRFVGVFLVLGIKLLRLRTRVFYTQAILVVRPGLCIPPLVNVVFSTVI